MMEALVEDLLSRLKGVEQAGDGWKACCPAHEDRNASLSVDVADDGKILVHCHAGCSFDEVCDAANVKPSSLSPSKNGQAASNGQKKGFDSSRDAAIWLCTKLGGTRWQMWPYQDAGGAVVSCIVRIDLPLKAGQAKPEKEIKPVTLTATGWVFRQMTGKRPLYRLPHVLKNTGRTFVVEGEKASEAGVSIGLNVTTSMHGADSAHKTDWKPLAGRDVVILHDNDDAGLAYANEVASILSRLTPRPTIRVVLLPGLMPKGDLFDFVEGYGEAAEPEDIVQAVDGAADATPEWAPPESSAEDGDDEDFDQWTSIINPEGRTDTAFARRFLRTYGEVVLWVPEWKEWLLWDGSHWKVDAGGCGVTRLALAISDIVWGEAFAIRTEQAVDYASDMSKPSKWSSALKVAAAQKAVAIEDLNSNRWLLNCPNGTVDLRTGELREHRKEDLLTTLCPTEFHPDAASATWQKFLSGVFPDADVLAYVRRLVGYATAGRAGKSEELLPVFYGTGSNGKSVFINAIRGTLGNEYIGPGTHGQLTEKANERHLTEVASLYGKRLVFCSETGQGAALDEDLVKSLTGGDAISARFCFKDLFVFEPTFTMFLVTNHKPRIRGTDAGIWRRVNLVPFTQRFWLPWKGEEGPDELRADPELKDKLNAERPAILAWIVAGCREWQSGGLAAPKAVSVATESYRSSEDVIGRFIGERCLVHECANVKFSDLYAAFVSWCDDAGENAASRKRFGMTLQEAGYEDYHSGGKHYRGIGLKS